MRTPADLNTQVAAEPNDGRRFQDQFFEQNPSCRSVFDLFRFLPSIYFYAKDANHRYVGINQATREHVFGLNGDDEILGRTDADFQPPALAQAYHAEDRRVMEGRMPIANQVWLVPHVRGTPQWFVSSKTPLFDPTDKVVGIAGVMYPIKTPEEQASYFHELLPVVKFLDANFTNAISMSDMAAMAGLSATHFNQRFKSILRMSPSEYVLSHRVQLARKLLTETTKSISKIGAEVGFYDQSHFTKRFRKIVGLTPNSYRNQFR
jgi:AraC-like DNA-binding protein